jgi:hypothetical protein
VTYSYSISAYNDIGEGPKTGNVVATPTHPSDTAPSAPVNLVNVSGDGYVNLSWNAPLSDGGSDIIIYKIYRNSITEVYDTVLSNQLWYNDTEVTNGMNYIYFVSAVNGIGEGPHSNEEIGCPTQTFTLNPPVLNDPGTIDDDGNYTISWSSINEATGYTLYEDINADFASPTVIYSGTSTFYQVEYQTNGDYFYKVQATASGTESAWSKVESISVNITDSDKDGLLDDWELEHFENLDQGPEDDFDEDGYINLDEYLAESDPANKGITPFDMDGDGLFDDWEQEHFGNLDQGPEHDFDEDDFSNLEELLAESDPADSEKAPEDTDGDELPDILEEFYFGNLDQSPANDFDGDGLTNIREFADDTDPTDKNDPSTEIQPVEKDEDFLSSYWWVFIILALVILVIIEAVLLIKRKGSISKEAQMDKENDKQEGPEIDAFEDENEDPKKIIESEDD